MAAGAHIPNAVVSVALAKDAVGVVERAVLAQVTDSVHHQVLGAVAATSSSNHFVGEGATRALCVRVAGEAAGRT